MFTELGKKGQSSGKGQKFITNLLVLLLIAFVGISIFGNLSRGVFTVKVPIFLTLVGLGIFSIYRWVLAAGESKDLKFEDFVLTFLIIGAIVAWFIFFPQSVPSSYSLIQQTMSTSPFGIGLQSMIGGP